jgi:hypothetical protein
MQCLDAAKEQVVQAGLQLMVLLYDGKTDGNLNKMRYAAYCNLLPTSKNVPHPQKLPTTERSALYRILRAHHQSVAGNICSWMR